MPCWTVQTNTVEIGKLNPAILSAGLAREGWRVSVRGSVLIAFADNEAARERAGGVDAAITIDLDAGTVTGRGVTAATVAELKRAFGREAVRVAAVRNGWRVVQTSGVRPIARLVAGLGLGVRRG